jgi:hypothetical protein
MFITKLGVDEIDDIRWELTRDLVFKTDEVEHRVPIGYVTDFASVPRATAWLYPRTGLYSKSAVLHDWLITDGIPAGIKSNDVDRQFREAMKVSGVTFPRRWIMWAGVRLGAIGNKKRRAGSLKTFPQVLLVLLLASPVVLIPSLVVQVWLAAMWLVSKFVPNRAKADAQKT